MRFFVQNIGDYAVIEGEEFNHLFKVLRLNMGDNITLFNGDGFNYNAIIDNIDKKSAVAKILSKEFNSAEPNVKITLFLALLKGEKMDLVAQKICELGASNLKLFESQFCDRKGDFKLDRLKKIIVSACKQCGRSSLINVDLCGNITNVCEYIKNYDLFLTAYEKENNNSLKNVVKLNQNIKNIAIMIGSEGGFSEDEIALLEKNGAVSVSLGKLIQRAETAGISSVAILANEYLNGEN